MAHGFVYLVAIMDWHTRHVLSWRLSTTPDTVFCLEALDEAIDRYGSPEIFNTDQGSQFTSKDWTDRLKAAEIEISMDGKGCWVDNVFVERLWRSLKHECGGGRGGYMIALTPGKELQEQIDSAFKDEGYDLIIKATIGGCLKKFFKVPKKALEDFCVLKAFSFPPEENVIPSLQTLTLFCSTLTL